MKDPIVPDIGAPPWSRDAIIGSLEAFEGVIRGRPFAGNEGGMGMPHLFATWFILRALAPATVIESGVWKGLGTWLIEQACPQARIISIDPYLGKRRYVSPKVTYYDIDFTEIDWSSIDRTNAVVFFDDHQNAINRLTQARWLGFRHVIFEDNDVGGSGDFYTLRHAFEHAGFGTRTAARKASQYTSFAAKAMRKLIAVASGFGLSASSAIPQYVRDQVAANRFDAYFLRRNLELYYEFPPVFAPEGKRACLREPLLGEGEQAAHPDFYRDRNRYNQLCYVALHPAV